MSAEERLLTEITLTSPDGNVFTGKWRSSGGAQTKTVAAFKTVGGNFGRVQNLGTDLRSYTYTVYFEGDDHDLTSQDFEKALTEDGAWTVQHPVLGQLDNQYPISFTPGIAPVESENITAVETSWITDYPEDDAVSQTQRAAEIQSSVDDLNTAAAESFEQVSSTDTFNLIDKINVAVDNVKTAVNDALGPLIETIEGAQDTMDAISLGIDETLDNVVGQTLDLAYQVETLCQTPAALLEGVEGKINGYKTAITSLISDTLTGTNEEKKNQAVSNQLTVISTFAGLSLSVIGNDSIETRPQAVELSDSIYDTFTELTNSLDSYSEEFDDLLYHERYFSQTDTFENLSILVSSVQLYLSELALSLKREKTITLKTPMSATMACLEYYDTGDDPELNTFIKTNDLTLKEIMLIPSGRELVIYV